MKDLRQDLSLPRVKVPSPQIRSVGRLERPTGAANRLRISSSRSYIPALLLPPLPLLPVRVAAPPAVLIRTSGGWIAATRSRRRKVWWVKPARSRENVISATSLSSANPPSTGRRREGDDRTGAGWLTRNSQRGGPLPSRPLAPWRLPLCASLQEARRRRHRRLLC